MNQWNNCLVKFNDNQKIAEKQIFDSYGKELVGVYEISVKTISLKLLETLDVHCMLACNFLTTYEVNKSGILERVFAPLKIFSINENRGSSKIVDIDSSRTYLISDVQKLKFWITDFSYKKVNLDITVHIVYRKARNV